MSEDQKRIMREIVGCLARAWVLVGAPDVTKEYIYVDHRWVEITIQYNGELEQPRRRVEDKS